MGRQQMVIRMASLLLPTSVRLRMVRRGDYREGDDPRGIEGWYEWEDAQGRAVFQESGLIGLSIFAIPASGVLGGDKVTDLTIDWDDWDDCRLKRKFLAHWVMVS